MSRYDRSRGRDDYGRYHDRDRGRDRNDDRFGDRRRDDTRRSDRGYGRDFDRDADRDRGRTYGRERARDVDRDEDYVGDSGRSYARDRDRDHDYRRDRKRDREELDDRCESEFWQDNDRARADRDATRRALGLGWGLRPSDLDPDVLALHHTFRGAGGPVNTGPLSSGPSVGRQHRRVFVGGLPHGFSEQDLRDFLEGTIRRQRLFGASESGPFISAISLHSDKYFAFVEFRTPDEATLALLLDGLWLRDAKLRFRRPKDFTPLPGVSVLPPSDFVLPEPIVSTDVRDSPEKVFIGNVPFDFGEVALEKMLASVGALKTFAIVRDPVTNASKGYGFAEYQDPSVTDSACAALNGMPVASKKLAVHRANAQTRPADTKPEQLTKELPAGGVERPADLSSITTDHVLHPAWTLSSLVAPFLSSVDPTRVVAIWNALTAQDAEDDAYRVAMEDEIRSVMHREGRVRRVAIRRLASDASVSSTTFVPAYVEFASADDARDAVAASIGRTFRGHHLLFMYVPSNVMDSIAGS